jgi:putative peptidoglycan lipid II flippase
MSYVVGAIVGHVVLTRRLGHLGYRAVLATTIRVAVASALGGVAAYGVVRACEAGLGRGHVGSLSALLLGGIVGLAVLGILAWRMRIPEVQDIVSVARGR